MIFNLWWIWQWKAKPALVLSSSDRSASPALSRPTTSSRWIWPARNKVWRLHQHPVTSTGRVCFSLEPSTHQCLINVPTEQFLLNQHYESLTFLTHTRQGPMPKSVMAKLHDTVRPLTQWRWNWIQYKDSEHKLSLQRDECISHVLKLVGVTVTDPKVAVTDHFLCTGGLAPLRDHIACLGGLLLSHCQLTILYIYSYNIEYICIDLPWQSVWFPPADGGGAVFKNHGRHTVQVNCWLVKQHREKSWTLGVNSCHPAFQVALVSWGTKTMCHRGVLMTSDEDSRDFHLNLFSVVPFLRSVLGNDAQDDFQPLKFLDE